MKVVLIAPNVSQNMGGEAIKAYQYFDYLLRQGYDVTLCTHERCRNAIIDDFPKDRMIFIEDDRVSIFLWKSHIFRPLLNIYFQILNRSELLKRGLGDAIWHFVTPISPVEPKMFPKGQDVVIGPLSGNIYYPSGFMSRIEPQRRLAMYLHRPAQWLCRMLIGDKRRAAVILNSGYERTRKSLSWAGADPANIQDVIDSALPDYVNDATPTMHQGENKNFVSLGRFVDDKGLDLGIKALAQCPPDFTLTLYGGGAEEQSWRKLAADLGVADRVNFAGWLEHADIVSVMSKYRGFVFPTLAEANGIVIQEMMMLGLPVVTLKWGGPADLASDNAAMFVEPVDEEHVVDGLAKAMMALADDADLANRVAEQARSEAEGRFTWDAVGQSWAAAYEKLT